MARRRNGNACLPTVNAIRAMKVSVRLEGSRIELAAARGDDGAEFVQRGDMPIGDRLIHQRPEMLGGLEFGRVGRQEDEADPRAIAYGSCRTGRGDGLAPMLFRQGVRAGAATFSEV